MKAILVIDEKPKTCEECRYSIKMGNNGHWFGEYCVLQSCGTDLDENGLDKYCPLKPMPQKKDLLFNELHFEEGYIKEGCTRGWKDFVKEKLTEYDMGYNKCIDEILEEEE